MTPELFWKHRDYILNGIPHEFESRIGNILLNDNYQENCRYQEIGRTGFFLGNFSAGKPPECWESFDVVVNCCFEEFESLESEKYLFLNIPDGKKGAQQFLKCIPVLLTFLKPFINTKKRILLHSKFGTDRAIGLLMCVFLKYYSHLFTMPVCKSSIMEAILLIQADWIIANPSRSTLKKITTYFLTKEPY